MRSAPQIRPIGADFEDEARLAERPAALEIAPLKRADAPRDRAVEASNPPNLIAVHSLTLVRVFWAGKGNATRSNPVQVSTIHPVARGAPNGGANKTQFFLDNQDDVCICSISPP